LRELTALLEIPYLDLWGWKGSAREEKGRGNSERERGEKGDKKEG